MLDARFHDKPHLVIAVFLRFAHGTDAVFLGGYVDVVLNVRAFFDGLVAGYLLAPFTAVFERPTILIRTVFNFFVRAFLGDGVAALDDLFDFRNAAQITITALDCELQLLGCVANLDAALFRREIHEVALRR